MCEAHIEHLVSFIKDQRVQFVKPHSALPQKVHKPPRRRHQDMASLIQVADLPVNFHPAKHRLRHAIGKFGIGPEALGNLAGQFARRRKHQHTRAFRPARLWLTHQIIERRQGKSSRLAGARLSNSQQVTIVQQMRYRLLLDRCRRFIALFNNGLQYGFMQAEVSKFRQCIHLFNNGAHVPNA